MPVESLPPPQPIAFAAPAATHSMMSASVASAAASAAMKRKAAGEGTGGHDQKGKRIKK